MKLSIVFKPSERGSGGFFVYDSTRVLLRVSESVESLTDVYRVLNDAYLQLYNAGHRGLIHVQFYEYYKPYESIKGYLKFKKNHPKFIKVLDVK